MPGCAFNMSAFITIHPRYQVLVASRPSCHFFHLTRTSLRSTCATFTHSRGFRDPLRVSKVSTLSASTPTPKAPKIRNGAQKQDVRNRLSEETKEQPVHRGDTLLLVGLGNPGPRFDKTPHNIGFDLVTEFAKRNSGDLFRSLRSVQGEVSTVLVNNTVKVHVLKPTTFMNLSGTSVKSALRHFNLGKEALLVVTDDISMELGRCRIRAKGSAGGHNGLKSIEKSLSSQEYTRLRIGVGIPTDASLWADYVLQKFSPSDRRLVEQVTWDVMDVLDLWTREPNISVVSNKLGMMQSGGKKR